MFLIRRNILATKATVIFLTYTVSTTALTDVFKTDKVSILAINFYVFILSEQIEFEDLRTV